MVKEEKTEDLFKCFNYPLNCLTSWGAFIRVSVYYVERKKLHQKTSHPVPSQELTRYSFISAISYQERPQTEKGSY